MKKKGIIIAIAAAVLVAVLILVLSFSGGNNAGTEIAQPTENAQPTDTAVPAEGEYKASLIYFVTDKEEADAADMIAELKNTYPQVSFEIKNIDKDPTVAENFSYVKGNTPVLQMLSASNDLFMPQFKCNDKKQIESAIKQALGE